MLGVITAPDAPLPSRMHGLHELNLRPVLALKLPLHSNSTGKPSFKQHRQLTLEFDQLSRRQHSKPS
jgi:hypothetical protein